jgi:hypothetical protein
MSTFSTIEMRYIAAWSVARVVRESEGPAQNEPVALNSRIGTESGLVR